MRTLLALLPAAALTACAGAGARPGTLARRGEARADERGAVLTPEASACRAAPLLTLGETVRGTTTGRADLFHATCAFGAASPDAVYRFRIEQPSHVAVRVSGSFDTVVYLRAACADDDSEVACNDDAGDTHHSAVEADLPAGEYFAFVDGYASEGGGFYTLQVRATPTRVVPALPRLARTVPGEGATVERAAGEGGVEGTVIFARRTYTPHGLTRATVDRPAPHFVVEAVDERGGTVASTDTDEQGRFRLDLPSGATVRVRALSRTRYLDNDIRVVSDPGTERLYEVSTRLLRVQGGERIVLRAGVGGVEPAGAFNILAQFVRYLPYVQRGFGRPLAPLYAFWRRGNNRALPEGNITAFLMDYHRHPGTYALQIQGGDPGREDESDSDQFDDPVILHEFSHFVVHTLAGHYSIGGMHPNGELHFPGQALDEGAASALASAVAGDGHYWDTAGLEPGGTILVDDDSESMPLPDRGLGSQNTAQSLVWDLIDGAEGIGDRDGDGVAIGLSGMMRVYGSFRDDPDAFPGIHTVLERAVALNLLTEAQATRLVRSPQDHGFDFPLPPAQQWPLDLALGGEVQGVVDGQSQPAPSGGRNSPINGYDAVRTFRLRVPRRMLVHLELAIQGPGTQASGTDLDMQLFTRVLHPVARSSREGPTESIRQMLEPGTYIVLVRDADGSPVAMRIGTRGNRAAFTLRARASTEFR
jgi:hypothetical protein